MAQTIGAHADGAFPEGRSGLAGAMASPSYQAYRILQIAFIRICSTNPGQGRGAHQRAGVSKATSESFRRFMPGKMSIRYSFTGAPNLRQDSTTETIAATFGPACALPTCNQFLRPKATGRIEFSARLLDSSTSA